MIFLYTLLALAVPFVLPMIAFLLFVEKGRWTMGEYQRRGRILFFLGFIFITIPVLLNLYLL